MFLIERLLLLLLLQLLLQLLLLQQRLGDGGQKGDFVSLWNFHQSFSSLRVRAAPPPAFFYVLSRLFHLCYEPSLSILFPGKISS